MFRRLFETVLFLLPATSVFAQQGTTELRGRVVDGQGGILPGVTVNVLNQATGMFRETVTGSEGSFIASGLAPGTYEVVAELSGSKKFNRRGLQLEVGKTASIDVALEVGGIEQTVTRTSRVAAGRRHVEGDGRQHHQRSARAADERQRQLDRVHRSAARHRAVDQHRVVRQ